MASIDPIRLAQFMVLPGAAELVEAFASLPPGEIRDSVVSHAQVLARAHTGWTPPFEVEVQAARPAFEPPPKPPPRLLSPFAKDLKSKSAEGQIVERALRGEPLHQIADDLAVPLGLVTNLIVRARQHGVVFPGDDETPQKRPGPLKGRKLAAMPLPKPPFWFEDPASPVWDNPKLLPNLSQNPQGTLAAVGPMDAKGYATMRKAAERAGLTLRQYIARRQDIVRRIEAGEAPIAVAKALDVLPYAVYELLTKVGRGRLQTVMARADAAPSQRGSTPSAQAAQESAAIKWGFKNLEAYTQARERVRELYHDQGLNPARIAGVMDVPVGFVHGAVAFWKDRGVIPSSRRPKAERRAKQG